MTEPVITCGPLWQIGEVGGQGFVFADGEAICPIRGMSDELDSMTSVMNFFDWIGTGSVDDELIACRK